MKKIICILSFIIIPTIDVLCQNIKIEGGFYEIKENRFGESIHFYPKNKFVYKRFTEFRRQEVHGKWRQRDSFLILDSYPQKDKLIVKEVLNPNWDKKKLIFCVRDNKNRYTPFFTYHLTVVTEKGDTISFRDQEGETIVSEKVKSFWLKDIQGLKSPVYDIQSTRNYLEVLFETDRIFQNEYWIILNKDSIRPIGFDGEYTPYILKRR